MAENLLDMSQYRRKAHFDYFRSLPWPYVGVTVEVEVSALLTLCRERGWSFYLVFLHAAALAADTVPELRQRIRGEGIVEYDSCASSHVEALADGTYSYCTLEHHLPLRDYLPSAEAARQRCREQGGLEEDEDVERMYFISTLPWLSYSALIQPVAGGDESNPRITWGKYTQDAQGRWQMPVSLLVHHALADGQQLAAFYDSLKRQMEALCLEAAAF